MTTFTSTQYQQVAPTPIGVGGLICHESVYEFASAVTLADGDIIKLAKLPPNYKLVGLRLDTDALGTNCAGAVGFLNSGGTALETTVIAIGSLASAAIKREDTKAGLRVAPSDNVSDIGVEITTSAGAALSAGAKVYLAMYYRPAQNIEV